MKQILLLIVFGLLVSCGPVAVIEPDSTDIYLQTSLGDPFYPIFENRICEKSESNTFKLTSFKYPREDSGNSVLFDQNFSQYTLAGEFESYYKYNVNSKKRSRYKIEKESGVALNICSDQEYGKVNSYESAGAYIYSHISLAKKFLNEMDIKVPEVRFKIAPKVHRFRISSNRSSKHSEETLLVNNAYFDYKYQEIVFLPQGFVEKGKMPFSGVPLWKIPFASVHEYGHHLFSSLMPNFYNEKEDRKKVCFDNHVNENSLKRPLGRSEGDPRKVDHRLVVTAINEGFSDLFAYYTLGKESGLNGIRCLSVSREVNLPSFISREDKKLTNDALDEFLLEQYMQPVSCNEKVNYQDVHMIGSIIAHGFDSIGNEMKLDKQEKFTLLLKWTKKLDGIVGKKKLLEEPRELLNYCLYKLLDQLKNYKNYSEKTLKLFYEKFPSLS